MSADNRPIRLVFDVVGCPGSGRTTLIKTYTGYTDDKCTWHEKETEIDSVKYMLVFNGTSFFLFLFFSSFCFLLFILLLL